MGRATALLFASRGARVVVGDINEVDGVGVAEQIRRGGGQALFRPADVTLESDVAAIVEATVAQFGRLDFAVNAAGAGHAPKALADLTLEEYESCLALNARSVFLTLKHEIRAMVRNGGGAIVNISSGAGLGGLPYQPAYAAAKHACLGLTRSAALEYIGQGVRINAIAPGVIATRLNTPGPFIDKLVSDVPLKRMGTPEEIAEAAVWLCSDHSSYIVGQALPVCGGYIHVAASGTMPVPDAELLASFPSVTPVASRI